MIEIDVLLVSGDRHATAAEWGPSIRHFLMQTRPLVLIHGAAPGIDTITADEAMKIGLIGIEPYPAEWEKWERLGKRNWAGPIRNQEMVKRLLEYADYGKRVHLLAIHPDIERSKGTRGMVEIARKRRVPITVWNAPVVEGAA